MKPSIEYQLNYFSHSMNVGYSIILAEYENGYYYHGAVKTMNDIVVIKKHCLDCHGNAIILNLGIAHMFNA